MYLLRIIKEQPPEHPNSLIIAFQFRWEYITENKIHLHVLYEHMFLFSRSFSPSREGRETERERERVSENDERKLKTKKNCSFMFMWPLDVHFKITNCWFMYFRLSYWPVWFCINSLCSISKEIFVCYPTARQLQLHAGFKWLRREMSSVIVNDEQSEQMYLCL